MDKQSRFSFDNSKHVSFPKTKDGKAKGPLTSAYHCLPSISSLLTLPVKEFLFPFALLQKGKVSRNKELLSDVYKIGSIVPKFATVSIPPEIWAQWDLQCYLIRYYTISLDVNYKNTYCIVYKNSNTDSLVNYKKINIQTLEYNLYKKK